MAKSPAAIAHFLQVDWTRYPTHNCFQCLLGNEGDCIVSKIGDMVPNIIIEINQAKKSIKVTCEDYIEAKPSYIVWNESSGSYPIKCETATNYDGYKTLGELADSCGAQITITGVCDNDDGDDGDQQQ